VGSIAAGRKLAWSALHILATSTLAKSCADGLQALGQLGFKAAGYRAVIFALDAKVVLGGDAIGRVV
jgi:hypothetical protein